MKLVRLGKEQPELYDLAADVGESRDLAAAMPEVVRNLLAAGAEWEQGTIAPAFEGAQQARGKKR